MRGNQLPAALQGSASELSELLNPYKVIELTHVLSHQKLHARFIIKNVPELPEIPDTLVVRLSDLDNYAFSRLTLRAIEQFSLSL